MKPCQAAIAGAVIVESAAPTKVAKAVKRIDASCKLSRPRQTPSQLPTYINSSDGDDRQAVFPQHSES
jgi:hypothetical protein